MASQDATQAEETAHRPVTGAEVLDYRQTAEAAEQRHEQILDNGRVIGLDNAIRVSEKVRRKEQALYMLFEHDLLPPEARACGDQMIRAWASYGEDWAAMAAVEAARRGVAVEDLQRLPESPPDVSEVEYEYHGHRLGSFLVEASDERTLGGTHEDTTSFFGYAKFRLHGGDGGGE